MLHYSTCSTPECTQRHYAGGLCSPHYQRRWRLAHPRQPKLLPLVERFWAKVNKTDTCWLWTATRNRAGYGKFFVDGKNRQSHRYAYELLTGPIPVGLQLDHLCRVRHCVNPDHLEPVTCRENLLRGDTFQARNAAKTECPQGHPYDEVNTYRRPNRPLERFCWTCLRANKAAFRARRRASRIAVPAMTT